MRGGRIMALNCGTGQSLPLLIPTRPGAPTGTEGGKLLEGRRVGRELEGKEEKQKGERTGGRNTVVASKLHPLGLPLVVIP